MTVNSEEQPENGGGEGVPGEPDETPGDSENETEILPEDPEETQEIRNEVPDGTGELSGDESVEISTEQQSEEQERVQTGDTDAGMFFFLMLLLVSLSVLGGILITGTRRRKQNKNGPKLLAGLILCSMLALSAGIRTEAKRRKGRYRRKRECRLYRCGTGPETSDRSGASRSGRTGTGGSQ